MQHPPEARNADHLGLAGVFSPLDILAELRQNSGRQFRMSGFSRLSPACFKEILYATFAPHEFVIALFVAVRICRGPGDARAGAHHARF
jgi:hypothetical protein